MKFPRVYIEITNVCGLQCSFCPPKPNPNKTIDLKDFDKITSSVKKYTDEITLHVVGDPLILPNLYEYIDIAGKNALKIFLTTSGFFLKKHDFEIFFTDTIKQINISLNSYNKNTMKISLEEYMEPILDLCRYKLQNHKPQFINLRLWNMGKTEDEKFNQKVFQILEEFFHTKIDIDAVYKERPKFIRVENKIRIHFDDYFQWPSLEKKEESDGFCPGLSSHFGILSNQTVVPCCLDFNGIVDLGNLCKTSLDEILASPKTTELQHSLKTGKPTEELCRKCTYKNRFKK